MNLLILKTDIRTREKVRTISPAFNSHPSIANWTVDTEDIDNVLRIEAVGNLTETDVDDLIKPFGLHCENLPD